jgi:hypothetical protein
MAAALATWAARSFQQLTAKGQLTAHTTTPASTQPEPAFSSSIASASEPTVADVAPVPGPMPAEPAPSPRVTRSPPAATDPRPTITLVEVPSDEAEGATRSNPAESLPLASGSATFIDPDADCGYEVDEESRAATIRVPGRPHVLSAELGRLNAPRLLWPLRGDFVASVRVAGTNSPAGPTTMKEFAPYHGAGLLLWQGPGDYLRLEIAREVVRGRTRSYINYEYRRAGRLAHSRGETLSEPANFVRLERKGNQVVAAFSADADQWVPDLPLDVGLDSRLQIGLVAINTASNALHARFDEFRVINTNPDPFTAVSVEVRPAKSAFRPSEPVALEVAIVNRSQTPLTIAGERDLAQRYRLVLTDTADKSLARSPHPIEPSASGRDRLLTLIPPGGSLADSIFVDHFRSAWPPGDYLIRIEVPIAPDDRAPKTTSLALTAKPAAIRIEP